MTALPLLQPIIEPIEDLVTAQTLNGTDFFVISQNGVTLKISKDAVAPYFASGGYVTGDIKMVAHTTAQSGWLRCDGTFYDPATYPALFAVIGYNYGEQAVTGFFAVPDYRGRVPMGDGTGKTHTDPDFNLTARTLGEYVGAETGSQAHSHTVTVANASLTLTTTVAAIPYNLTATGNIAVAPFVPLGTIDIDDPEGAIAIDDYVGDIVPVGNIALDPHDHTVATVTVNVAADPAILTVADDGIYTTSSETVTGSFTGVATPINHTHTGTFTGSALSGTFTGSSTSTTATFTGTPLTGNLNTTATTTVPAHNHTASTASVTVTIPIIQPSTVCRFLIKI